MAKNKRSFRGWLMHTVFLLIVLGVLCFGIALGILTLAEKNPPPVGSGSQAIIVLGAQVYPDGRPSPQLELRLEAALSLWHQNPRPIIVCGAQGSNEPEPEGDIMKAWLTAHGVPSQQITAETASRNTRQNLQNAGRLLPEGTERVTIVTSDYHLPRALRLARDEGLTADGVGSPCKPEYWIKNHFREVLAWGKYAAEKLGVLRQH